MSEGIVHYIQDNIVVAVDTAQDCIDKMDFPNEEVADMLDNDGVRDFIQAVQEAVNMKMYVGIITSPYVGVASLSREYEVGEFVEGISEQ